MPMVLKCSTKPPKSLAIIALLIRCLKSKEEQTLLLRNTNVGQVSQKSQKFSESSRRATFKMIKKLSKNIWRTRKRRLKLPAESPK